MRGHTLIELVIVLLLAALSASAFAPTARRYRDRAAVVSAREATVGLLAEARVAAIATGGARVTIESSPWTARASVGDSVLSVVSLERELGVSIQLRASKPTTEIAYNPLGLGRFAGETVVFVRGDARATLIVSSLGRARRR